MSASALSMRQRASESMFIAGEEKMWIVKRLERLVAEGKVDSSVLAKAQALTRAHTPEDAVRRRASVFQFEKGVTPVPSRARASPTRYALGMQVSLGRTRWSSEGVNVFSVAEGKRLASTPAPHMTHYESIRHEKMQRAALESPQIRGYRL
ncbi:hypothetical protein H632_c3781p0, partial [Helicosporidium sp. ATCC 50920]